jgi:hypothetical protein
MPLGNQAWVDAKQVPITGPLYAPPLGAGGMPPGGQAAPAGQTANIWRNFTLPGTASVWPGGLATMNFGTPISVLEVFARGVNPLFISWQGPNNGTAGSYQLFHPGGGQVVEVLPFVTNVWICTGTGAPPDGTVEVIGKGGQFGLQASAALAPGSPPP